MLKGCKIVPSGKWVDLDSILYRADFVGCSCVTAIARVYCFLEKKDLPMDFFLSIGWW